MILSACHVSTTLIFAYSTLSYPRCTEVLYGIYPTDCGSTAWAFSLFIAWNLLSMVMELCFCTRLLHGSWFPFQYIFVNMFTGVIVQSFSYVFQSTGGVLKSITRQEIRAFKNAWAQFSDPNSGLLERPNLVPFLAVGPFPRIVTQLLNRYVCFPEARWRVRSPGLSSRVLRRVPSSSLSRHIKKGDKRVDGWGARPQAEQAARQDRLRRDPETTGGVHAHLPRGERAVSPSRQGNFVHGYARVVGASQVD